MRNSFIFLLSLCFSITGFAFAQDIQFESDIKSEILKNCKRDFKHIYQKCNKRIHNPKSILVKVEVDSSTTSTWKTNHSFDNLSFKDPNFQISAYSNDTIIRLNIKARSAKGASNGVFAFLQQVVGVEFRHMSETIYPDSITLPNFSLSWHMSGAAKFEKMGFHLQTLKPIELTEYLHNGTDEGLEMIMLYIDWLAKNGQNYFEFSALESIDMDTWKNHILAITEYAHQRGIKVGIEVSMDIAQEKTFMLYRKFPHNWKSKWKQVKSNLAYLTEAGLDVIHITASPLQYVELEKINHLLDSAQHFLASHSVKMMNRLPLIFSEKQEIDAFSSSYKNQGFLLHTTIYDRPKSSRTLLRPTIHLSRTQKILQKTKEKKEVWLYPESPNIKMFDISIPFLNLHYISARLTAIDSCANYDVQGHLTRTSGWEFGYWFMDWTIAQNCWKYNYTLQKENTETKIRKALKSISDLQNEVLIGEHLIKYIPSTILNDQLKDKFNLAPQPEPRYSYDYWMNEATKSDLDSLNSIVIPRLTEFASQHNKELEMINLLDSGVVPRDILLALEISSLRAFHRVSTLRAIAANGYQKRNLDVYHSADYHLKEAMKIREKALLKVEEMRSFYRFDSKHLEYKAKDYTAYRFGYLYPTVGLHFWKKEEMQIEKNNFSPYKDNIYNFKRILGIIN